MVVFGSLVLGLFEKDSQGGASKDFYQCINCNACVHKVHALVNFLLILACNDLMHLGI